MSVWEDLGGFSGGGIRKGGRGGGGGWITNATRSLISTGRTKMTAAREMLQMKSPEPTTDATASSTSTAWPIPSHTAS